MKGRYMRPSILLGLLHFIYYGFRRRANLKFDKQLPIGLRNTPLYTLL